MDRLFVRFCRAARWRGKRLNGGCGAVVVAALLCGTAAVPAQIFLQLPPAPPGLSGPDANIKLPAFDVVSVKENQSHGPTMMVRIGSMPNGFLAENFPLKDLVAQAYGVRGDLISGLPDWAGATRFDINAKVADEDVATLKKLSSRERNAMLIPLLADRFKLQAHKEPRILPTYDLVVDKGGLKLPASQPAPPRPAGSESAGDAKPAQRFTIRPGQFTLANQPMGTLTNQLAYLTHRTVVDKTGLTGKYDLDLKWTPEPMYAAGPDNGADDPGGSIFTALREQLGLRLVPSKGPVDTLIVDHLERPSEN